jgi:site-specific DNA-methyltransferase (adenine-specific)
MQIRQKQKCYMTNKNYNESNLETMARMPDNFVDLTVTSPPYDNLRAYNGYCFDFEKVAKELFRVTKQGGIVVWVVGDKTDKGSETGTSFKQALYFKFIGFNLHDTMIYQRKTAPLTHNRYEQEFEYMFVFSKGKPKTVNHILIPTVFAGKNKGSIGKHRQTHNATKTIVKDKRIKGNIWQYAVGGAKINHPAIFPEQLANDHIISWSNEGDLIYDPFMGSGTTAKMAIVNSRNWVGSEISEEYCSIIEQRVRNC